MTFKGAFLCLKYIIDLERRQGILLPKIAVADWRLRMLIELLRI